MWHSETNLFGDGLNYKTVRKKIGALKTLFNKAVNDSKIESNPCQGVSVPSAEAEDKPREIFSGEDLRTIYSARIYSEGFRPAGCGIDAAVWVPVIGLFTGMRLEEICQLRVADLERDDELGYYIRIDDEDGKRLKTIWARRNVPVHAELIRLGLVEFFLGKRSRGERLMFPDLGIDKYGRQSSRFTKKWNEELHKTLSGPRRNSSLTFHSFRHTFKHICRDCHIPEDVHDALTGHKGDNSKTVSRGYGHKYYPRGPLCEAIRRYVVRGLDLSHLKLPSTS